MYNAWTNILSCVPQGTIPGLLMSTWWSSSQERQEYVYKVSELFRQKLAIRDAQIEKPGTFINSSDSIFLLF